MARRRQTGFVRKEKEWTALTGGDQALTGNGTTQLGGSVGFSQTTTIMRILGEYVMSPTSAPVVNDIARVTMGVGVLATDVERLTYSS